MHHRATRSRLLVMPAVAAALLAGCDMVGIESPSKAAAVREAEGRAIGSACRHAARAIEDCYTINVKADKAAVFAGWREMNDYMRENKIEPVAPVIAASGPPPATTAHAGDADADGADEKRPNKSGSGKSGGRAAKSHDS